MARFSVNELTTFRWTFEEDVYHYRQAQIEAIGVWRQKLSDFGEEKGLELLAESGLRVSSLLWAGGFTGSEGPSFDECLADARNALRLANALRASCLIVHSGSRHGHTQNHAKRLLCNALEGLLPIAEEFNVVLALEPRKRHLAGSWTFLTELEATCEFVAELNNPRIKIALDTHYFGRDPWFLTHVNEVAPLVGIVHLADSRAEATEEENRCPLGQGDVPLEQIVAGLTTAGYDGYFEVELMGEEIEVTDYAVLLDDCRQAFDRLGASSVET